MVVPWYVGRPPEVLREEWKERPGQALDVPVEAAAKGKRPPRRGSTRKPLFLNADDVAAADDADRRRKDVE